MPLPEIPDGFFPSPIHNWNLCTVSGAGSPFLRKQCLPSPLHVATMSRGSRLPKDLFAASKAVISSKQQQAGVDMHLSELTYGKSGPIGSVLLCLKSTKVPMLGLGVGQILKT